MTREEFSKIVEDSCDAITHNEYYCSGDGWFEIMNAFDAFNEIKAKKNNIPDDIVQNQQKIEAYKEGFNGAVEKLIAANKVVQQNKFKIE